MSILFQNKIVNVVLLVIMLSHLTFLHELLQNYAVCYGADGHISIENVSNCTECTGLEATKSSTGIGNIIIKNFDCKDIALDENCFEEDQFIIQNTNVVVSDELKIYTTVFSTDKEEKSRNIKTDGSLTKNYILENYSTVSLTI